MKSVIFLAWKSSCAFQYLHIVFKAYMNYLWTSYGLRTIITGCFGKKNVEN